jgi:hypothetical protein
MTALALELCCTMMVDRQHHANAGMLIRERVLPQALVLVKSSLLQGQALQMLQGFFAALVQSANTSFKTLLESLLSTARSTVAPGGPVSKQAFYSIAQCAAVLCLAAGDAECSSTVAMLVTTLRTSNGTDAVNSSSGMAVNLEICCNPVFPDPCGLSQHCCHDLALVRPLSGEEQQYQLSNVFGDVMVKCGIIA